MEGMVFNIQKFSVHDGSGIRSIVFLKGCPLACRWCSNPEGIHKNPQFFFREDRCIGENECGLCKEGCKKQAIQMEDGRPVFLESSAETVRTAQRSALLRPLSGQEDG